MSESKAAADKKAAAERLEAYGNTLIAAIDALLEPPGAPVTVTVDYPAKVEVVEEYDADDNPVEYENTVYEAGALTVTIQATV